MKGPRVNKRIRANEVRLITHEGDNIGVVPIGEAAQFLRVDPSTVKAGHVGSEWKDKVVSSPGPVPKIRRLLILFFFRFVLRRRLLRIHPLLLFLFRLLQCFQCFLRLAQKKKTTHQFAIYE